MTALVEDRIRTRGLELGFLRVAFSPAGLAPRAEAFRGWLARGFAGEMAYLARDPDQREDVTRRSPWARSVVSVSMGYGRPSRSGRGISPFVSAYARGLDYHQVVGDRLEQLASFIRAEAGGSCQARALVDTSAILERDHGASSGIGWTAKNAMVIDPEAGSYFFLGEIVTDLELTPGMEIEDLCGTCTRCIDACPTKAIVEPRVVDSRRCISYLTIELRGRIDAALRPSMEDHLFGCDVCQEVCPWNRQAPESGDGAFETIGAVADLTLEDAVAIEPAQFAARFKGSAISRAKRSGFVRNALIVAANRGDGHALRSGRLALADADPVVRETAVWALARGDAPEREAAARSADSEPDTEVRAQMRASLGSSARERFLSE